MGFGRGRLTPVDRQDILGASRKRDDHIVLGPQDDIVSRSRHGFLKRQGAIHGPWDVHEKVQRRWHPGYVNTQLLGRKTQIIRTVVVIVGAPEQTVAFIVASRHQRIVDTGRGVFLEVQNGSSPVGLITVSECCPNLADGRPGGIH